MIVKKILRLEWLQFTRSLGFQQNLFIKILMGIGLLFFAAIFMIFGGGFFFFAQKVLPETDPLELVNNYVIFWFLFSLIIRYFLQQLPVINIKPLLTIPIKRNTIIHFLLGKTFVSPFNFFPLLFLLPFSVVLLYHDYPPVNVVFWFLSLKLLVLSNNLINFLINKNDTAFYSIVSILGLFVGLEYFSIFKISLPIGIVFNYIYQQPLLVIAPIILLTILYFSTFKLIRKGFYIDDVIQDKKQKNVQIVDLSWMNRFGSMAPFLKNDIKLISRNARPKQVVMMSFLFLFYGLIFYTNKTYADMPAFLAFASVFVTGGFLMSFGQLVPAWDSEYYKMLMSQNIPYKQYLKAKWTLMTTAVTISFILSIPYLYFGTKIFGMIAAGALFNIGLNSFFTLLSGALNKIPIELNVKAKAFNNTNKFNLTQVLVAMPKIILPMLLFYVPYKFISFNAGILTLALSGVLGIVFKNFFINKIEKIYQKEKYKTIAAFSENQ